MEDISQFNDRTAPLQLLALLRAGNAWRRAHLRRRELRRILKCCETPAEELAVRLLVGAELRESELCGLRVKGSDGSPNLIPDPSEPGRFLLRVLWDAGSKGKKTRFVPISAKLAAHLKRYIASSRPPESTYPELLISRRGQPFRPDGVKSMMNFFKRRLGFRIHAPRVQAHLRHRLCRWTSTWRSCVRRWGTPITTPCSAT